ncbi:MAG TPA: DUF4249 family protein [Bacteroidales bacterium]|nr:DUF4249 family protein [Bacteroidales bacterium]
MKKIIFYFCLLLFVSCEKQAEWPIQAEETPRIVIDGILTNESGTHSIHVCRTVSELNMTPQAVSGAGVIISDADSSWFLTEQPGNPGFYITKNNFSAKPGVLYTLLVTSEGTVYSAKTQSVPVTPFENLRYGKNPGESLYHITWVANPYNAIHPAMYEILLDWSQLPEYSTQDSASCTARLFYYSLPTLDVSEVFAPEIERIKFPAGTKITERKYSLTKEHVDFVRAMISETTWKGGLFDSAPANVPTNISNGALGFFAACNVITVSLVVQ